MAYKYLFYKKLKTTVFPLQHFMQWGTPQDFEEYLYYSKIFRRTIKSKIKTSISGNLVIPMAGLGQRFKDEGYKETKPLIEVSGRPMVIQALNSLPFFDSYNFVIQKKLNKKEKVINYLSDNYGKIKILELDNKTDGQATTIDIGINDLDDTSLLHIVSCDNGYHLEEKKLMNLISNDIDVISWAIKDYPFSKINPD